MRHKAIKTQAKQAAGHAPIKNAPRDADGGAHLRLRRTVFFLLVIATALAALAALTAVLGQNGLSFVDLVMIAFFAVTLPWTVIGFWNAVFGLGLALFQAATRCAPVAPLARLDDHDRPLEGRTAIVMPVYDEDPRMVLGHLEATIDDLEAAGGLEHVEIFLLSRYAGSFSRQPTRPALWRIFTRRIRFADRFHYRRRTDNCPGTRPETFGNGWSGEGAISTT